MADAKVLQIQARFGSGKGVATLAEPGRRLILEGTMRKMCRKGPEPRVFFLFNDLLVYGSKTLTGGLKSQKVMPLNECSVNEECQYEAGVEHRVTKDLRNAFQINGAKSFHVYATTAEERRRWLVALKEQIAEAEAATGGSPRKKSSQAAVWVPDAKVSNCMICKTKFTLTNRKHHCRRCGSVACGPCTSKRAPLEEGGKDERLCAGCYDAVVNGVVAETPSAKDPAQRVDVEAMATLAQDIGTVAPRARPDTVSDYRMPKAAEPVRPAPGAPVAQPRQATVRRKPETGTEAAEAEAAVEAANQKLGKMFGALDQDSGTSTATVTTTRTVSTTSTAVVVDGQEVPM